MKINFYKISQNVADDENTTTNLITANVTEYHPKLKPLQFGINFNNKAYTLHHLSKLS